MEAKRLDQEFPQKDRLTDQINRLTFILEHEEISSDKAQQEIEEKCINALTFISDIRAKLKL